MRDTTTFANAAVLEFYKTLPFNIRETVEGSVEAVRRTDYVPAYPVLRALMRPGLRVLDVGCGTGWFANSIAYHHKAEATGLDFNSVAVERARAVAAAMGLRTTFSVGDLFLYEPPEPFDLVVSLGVLHHTDNCQAAVRRVCEKFVRPGGYALIGLYHAYGRKPLLDHFEAMKKSGATEADMLERYRQLHSTIKDETLLLSWFRDQVLHPHETQHTLQEMVPVLEQAGMRLAATSVNRFQPIDSLPALYGEEKAYFDLGVQRLKQNEYFTGFFVLFARKADGGTAESASAPPVADSKSYVAHHPLFGYHYIPGTDLELPRPDGGRYRIRVNSQGIRSDREYSLERPPKTRRIIVCGDSMAAGQYISNEYRFSELLERRIPGLEVVNLSLEGSGTDQQLLLYEHIGLKYEHDAVLLLPFLQNIRRNMAEARESIDPKSGKTVLRPKPRFELVNGTLVLRNVPVPKEVAEEDRSARTQTDAQHSWRELLKSRISALPGAPLIKKFVYAAVPWEPFPEYRDPESPQWQMMSAIIHRVKSLAGTRPLVVVPTFYASYVRYRMATNYVDRYSELAKTPGIHFIDVLPNFRSIGKDAVRSFQEPYDMHFSMFGHLVLAEALQAELGRLRLLDL